jgi:hypothetical protein
MTDIAQLGIQVSTVTVPVATKQLDAMAVSAGRADMAAQDLAATSRGRLVGGMTAGGNQSRMMAQQLSQVAQQASATGNWVQALAILLPDMALGFGAVGIAAGVLASVTLPLLASMFSSNSEEAKAAAESADRLKAALDALVESGRAAQTDIDKLRFGVDEDYQVELLREQIRLRDEINRKVQEGNSYLATTTDSVDLQRIKAAEVQAEVDKLGRSYNENANLLARQQERATTLSVIEGVRVQRANEIKAKQEEVAAATKKVEQSLLAAGISAETLAGFSFSNIAEAAAFAQNLAVAMQSALNYSAELALTGQSSGPDSARSLGQFGGGAFRAPVRGAGLPFVAPSGGGGGGGGGGGSDPYQSDLDALIENLRSEREIEDEWYQENLAILQDRRAQEVLGKQAHDAALISLHEEYNRRIAEIDANAFQQRITDTANLFGALAGVAQAGGQKTAKIVATFQAIEGTINAYGAAVKALNTPGLTLAGRFAAYASVLGAGLKGVAAIRAAGGVAGGGSFGGGSVAAQGATAPTGQNIEYRIYGLERDAVYSGAFIEKLFAGLMEEGKRRNLNTQTVQFV